MTMATLKSLLNILALFSLPHFISASSFIPRQNANNNHTDTRVLILGGGVAGIIAARTLHDRGLDNFLIIDARPELGGRMQDVLFGEGDAARVVELGPNWVQGTQTGDGPKNPILSLAEKWDVKTQFNDLYGSLATFDYTGEVDYLDTFNDEDDDFTDFTVVAGERVQKQLIDASARTGYGLVGSHPLSPQAQASEYYLYDWEYAQTPEQSSWIASSLNNNFTFEPEMGGFSEDNLLSIDQRGFKTLIQDEAASFLQPSQVLLNATVTTVKYNASAVEVTLEDGRMFSVDYAICTFSVGVLQNDDVKFEPVLPDWKQEAIQSTTMATYTKIFLQFPHKFWFGTQMALYADKTRGRYPVWQSLDHKDFFPGSGIIFVTVTGDYSKRIESLSDSEVQEEVISVLQLMYPNITIPEPTAFMFPRWNSNKLFRGSYSNWPASFVRAHQENLRATVDKRLWFAGEATSFKYYGFLHGAYFEGLNVTNKLVDCVQAGGCAEGLGHLVQAINGCLDDVSAGDGRYPELVDLALVGNRDAETVGEVRKD